MDIEIGARHESPIISKHDFDRPMLRLWGSLGAGNFNHCIPTVERGPQSRSRQCTSLEAQATKDFLLLAMSIDSRGPDVRHKIE